MTKETTEISLVGVLHRLERDKSLAYQFRQKESPATMTLTMEVDDTRDGITGLVYDNARVTVTIEVDSEAEYVGFIPE